MDRKDLVAITNNAIETLIETFRKSSTYFFTENDIVCYLYYILQQKLKYFPVKDNEGKPQFLVHMGFPTPFRCDLIENRFSIKEDTERTPNGGLYKRGHYDLVVLNPEFIKNNDFQTVKAQNYEVLKDKTLKQTDKNSPMVVYGLEFMYQRDPFKSNEEINIFAEKVIQDADKLVESQKFKDSGFMENIKMIALVKDKENPLLKEKLSRPEIVLKFAG